MNGYKTKDAQAVPRNKVGNKKRSTQGLWFLMVALVGLTGCASSHISLREQLKPPAGLNVKKVEKDPVERSKAQKIFNKRMLRVVTYKEAMWRQFTKKRGNTRAAIATYRDMSRKQAFIKHVVIQGATLVPWREVFAHGNERHRQLREALDKRILHKKIAISSVNGAVAVGLLAGGIFVMNRPTQQEYRGVQLVSGIIALAIGGTLAVTSAVIPFMEFGLSPHTTQLKSAVKAYHTKLKQNLGLEAPPTPIPAKAQRPLPPLSTKIQSVAPVKAPVMKKKTPEIKRKTPVAKRKTPVAKRKTPVAKRKTPAAKQPATRE